MLNKKLVVFCSLFLVAAQMLTAETSVKAPVQISAPSAVKFSPAIWIGARSNSVGLFSRNTKDANTFGPFLRPAFAINYNSAPFSLLAKYSFETSAAKGFGSGNDFKDISNNTYFQHEPVIFFSGKANDLWKINAFGDLWVNTENKRSQNTFYELTIQPDLEYQVNSTFSVALGYQYFRKNYFDTTFIGDASNASEIRSAATVKQSAFRAASVSAIGQSPLTTINAAIITGNLKLAEKSSLVAYFRAGRQVSTIQGRTGINYRLNADLNTPITQKLSTQLRYRLNFEDNDAAKAWFYNRGRVIVSYAFTKSWSADVQDTLTIEQTTADSSQAKFINENYAGVTYKF
ncbi:MAG: hypothetical protein JWQ35_180 [Bacteriovoracaceae bacterium]|nr:hypothetical protein [Bacteriovoracaceae bacterium]